MPDRASNEFWRHRGVITPLSPSLAEPGIVALESAHRIFAAAFDTAPELRETSGMVRCAFENLSNRVYEQAAGMLVCLGTGSAAAAETLARTVIEGALTLQFIVSKDHEARLFAFFYQYLKEHDRRLSEWKELETAKTQTAEVIRISKAIEERISSHQEMFDFVKNLAKAFGFERHEAVSAFWPASFAKRCEQIERSRDYRTSYHRLSASSHINAEETIRWLFATWCDSVVPDKRPFENLSLETVSYSAMMTRVAVFHFIEANIFTCRALGADFDATLIGETLKQLVESIDEIASAAGSPV